MANNDDAGREDSRESLAWATVTPRRCRRHEWVPMESLSREQFMVLESYGTPPSSGMQVCGRCFRPRDLLASRRGLNNRQRGNAIERDVARQLGLRRVGQYGGPEDVAGDAFVVQVKSGRSFPERLWTWLKALPANAGQTPLVVITDAPGPGHRRRALVVLTLEDWIALHGPLE